MINKIKEQRIIILLIVFQIVLVGFVVAYAKMLDGRQLIVAAGIIIVGILIDGWVYFSLAKAKEKEEIERQLEVMREEQEYEKRSFERDKILMDNMKAKREEFYQTLDILCEKCCHKAEEKDIKEAFNNTEKSLSGMRMERYCESQIVNAILTSKLEEMKSKDISVKISIDSLTDNMGIEKIDLCSTFSNIIDNAMEACMKVDNDRFVHIRTKNTGVYFALIVENASNGKLYKKGKLFRTTKENKDNHGYGTKILSMIAERYNGKYELEMNGNVAKASIVFDLSNNIKVC